MTSYEKKYLKYKKKYLELKDQMGGIRSYRSTMGIVPDTPPEPVAEVYPIPFTFRFEGEAGDIRHNRSYDINIEEDKKIADIYERLRSFGFKNPKIKTDYEMPEFIKIRFLPSLLRNMYPDFTQGDPIVFTDN
uniref:Uncharacterized protein n=1 Tax=Megaviridae environmental sample TaxID=1737588 RepID=A0A5J6VK74_9VIRU|nr:MAG: hypothetical protein [Megaviridae environmental sample]